MDLLETAVLIIATIRTMNLLLDSPEFVMQRQGKKKGKKFVPQQSFGKI